MTDYKIKLLDLDNEIESIQNLLRDTINTHIESSPNKKYQLKNGTTELEIVPKTVKAEQFVNTVQKDFKEKEEKKQKRLEEERKRIQSAQSAETPFKPQLITTHSNNHTNFFDRQDQILEDRKKKIKKMEEQYKSNQDAEFEKMNTELDNKYKGKKIDNDEFFEKNLKFKENVEKKITAKREAKLKSEENNLQDRPEINIKSKKQVQSLIKKTESGLAHMTFNERNEYQNKKKVDKLNDLRKSNEPQFTPQTISRGTSRQVSEMMRFKISSTKVTNLPTQQSSNSPIKSSNIGNTKCNEVDQDQRLIGLFAKDL